MKQLIIAAESKGAAASKFKNMADAAVTRNALRSMLRALGHKEVYDGKTNTFVINGLKITIK